jgi:apolipoprotein N-acyltransferase
VGRSHPARSGDRLGYLWLAVGTVVSLFAVHGRWDLPLAAWMFGVFFLRFTRTRRPIAGLVGVWVAFAVDAAFWLYESGLDPLSPVLLLCLALNTVLVLPYLVDRLVAPRLANPLAATLVFPLARVAAEYLNATLSPAGAIWGSLAATQHDNLPLLQTAAVTGSYGVSFLIAWFAAICATAWQRRNSRQQMRGLALIFGAVLAAVLIGGGMRLAFVPPSAATVRVAGVSPPATMLAHRTAVLSGLGSLQQATNADPTLLRPVFDAVNTSLLRATDREAQAGAKIIIWPEAGAAVLAPDEPDLLARAGALARQHGVYLDIGLGVLSRQRPYARNQAILIDPQGRVVWTYDKARPVPGMDKLTPGDGRVPTVDTPYGRLANVICFDADFPALARQGGQHRVDLMLVPSNDWRDFGTVHTQKATLRAIENGYSLIRPDTHGLAQAVDYQGHVLASTDYFGTGQQTVVAYVPTDGARTIYAAVGDVFAWLCTAVLLLLAGAAARNAVRQRHLYDMRTTTSALSRPEGTRLSGGAVL